MRQIWYQNDRQILCCRFIYSSTRLEAKSLYQSKSLVSAESTLTVGKNIAPIYRWGQIFKKSEIIQFCSPLWGLQEKIKTSIGYFSLLRYEENSGNERLYVITDDNHVLIITLRNCNDLSWNLYQRYKTTWAI